MIRKTTVVEVAHDFHGFEILREIKLVRGISAIENEIERILVRLVPVLIFGANEILRAELNGVFRFVG